MHVHLCYKNDTIMIDTVYNTIYLHHETCYSSFLYVYSVMDVRI
jgi:hypothetical protein